MPGPQKTKELKTFSMQVITQDHIKRDPKKIKILYIVRHLGSISEKALTYLLYLLKNEKGIDLGYSFITIGNKVMSKQILDDIMALLYTGLLESDPRTKKLRVTSNGLDFLERNPMPTSEINDLLKAIDELRGKVLPIDIEVEELARQAKK